VPAYPGSSTKKGSKAKARVKQIQQALADKGYNVGPVDGSFGPMTDAAVRDFQKDAGEYVDGIVGPKTWAALFG
jgi:peptidoglycan hydrolase-like protein with peptidoglycan-binding domain